MYIYVYVYLCTFYTCTDAYTYTYICIELGADVMKLRADWLDLRKHLSLSEGLGLGVTALRRRSCHTRPCRAGRLKKAPNIEASMILSILFKSSEVVVEAPKHYLGSSAPWLS